MPLFTVCRHLTATRITQTLTILDLHYNEIGAAGAEYLADALKVNRVGLPFVTIGSHLTAAHITDTHNTRRTLQRDR